MLCGCSGHVECMISDKAAFPDILINVFIKQVQSKDLDMWWSGIENRLADILSGDDLCNYFDFIGNFDDQYFFLFVKTAEHLCTVNYHCRLPSDTATHYVTYASAVKLLSKTGEPASLGI